MIRSIQQTLCFDKVLNSSDFFRPADRLVAEKNANHYGFWS